MTPEEQQAATDRRMDEQARTNALMIANQRTKPDASAKQVAKEAAILLAFIKSGIAPE